MDEMSERDEIRIWRAEREISRVILRYVRGVDGRDFEQVRACFHSDARICYGDWFEGDLDEGIAFLARAIPRLQSTLHVFGTPWIELDFSPEDGHNESGATAVVETYAVNSATYQPDADGVVVENVSGTKYFDQFKFRDGRWALTKRQNRRIWSHNLPKGSEPALPGSDPIPR